MSIIQQNNAEVKKKSQKNNLQSSKSNAEYYPSTPLSDFPPPLGSPMCVTPVRMPGFSATNLAGMSPIDASIGQAIALAVQKGYLPTNENMLSESPLAPLWGGGGVGSLSLSLLPQKHPISFGINVEETAVSSKLDHFEEVLFPDDNPNQPLNGDNEPESANFSDLMEQIASCGKTYTMHHHKKIGCGAKVGTPNYCGSKWCRTCFNRWLIKSRRKVFDIVSQYVYPQVWNLGMSSDFDLDKIIKKFNKCFKELRKTDLWKDHVTQGVSFIGLTYNPAEGWHYHLHLIVDCAWIDANDVLTADGKIMSRGLISVWTEIVNRWQDKQVEHAHAYVQRVTNVLGAVNECLHGTKVDMKNLFCHFKKSDALFEEAVTVLKNKRWYNYVGKRIAKSRLLPSRVYCPKCGDLYHGPLWERFDMTKEQWEWKKIYGGSWADCYDAFAVDEKKSPADSWWRQSGKGRVKGHARLSDDVKERLSASWVVGR